MEMRSIIDLAGTGFEVAGVAILVIGAVVAAIRFAFDLIHRRTGGNKAYQSFREGLARAVMLGLEFLVAADIIRSVALEPTFQSVGVLGLIVAVRTFLSWSLEVEITGHWPWYRSRRSGSAVGDEHAV